MCRSSRGTSLFVSACAEAREEWLEPAGFSALMWIVLLLQSHWVRYRESAPRPASGLIIKFGLKCRPTAPKDMTMCSLIDVYRRFGEMQWFELSKSKTRKHAANKEYFYQTVRCHIPDDSVIYSHRLISSVCLNLYDSIASYCGQGPSLKSHICGFLLCFKYY
jgi:hypothetical protein